MNTSLELLYLIVFTGILAVAYSYLLSGQIISSSPGNQKMQEIAEAIQIGAKAYLNRQYKTIAIVGFIVLIIVSYFFSLLVGLGYFIGAFLSGVAGYVGMLISVKANVRTAEAANADGVIIPERRAAQLTEGTFKSSAGGVTHLPVSRVKNLVQTIGWLQTQKIWVVGADVSGTKVYTQADLRQPTCLVLGGEENGLRHLTKERCDFCVSIPMLGKIASLNVSVAAGILLYEVIRQREQTINK